MFGVNRLTELLLRVTTIIVFSSFNACVVALDRDGGLGFGGVVGVAHDEWHWGRWRGDGSDGVELEMWRGRYDRCLVWWVVPRQDHATSSLSSPLTSAKARRHVVLSAFDTP